MCGMCEQMTRSKFSKSPPKGVPFTTIQGTNVCLGCSEFVASPASLSNRAPRLPSAQLNNLLELKPASSAQSGALDSMSFMWVAKQCTNGNLVDISTRKVCVKRICNKTTHSLLFRKSNYINITAN